MSSRLFPLIVFIFLSCMPVRTWSANTTIEQNVNTTVPYINAGKSADKTISSTALGFQVNGTEYMRVTATGSVGIGTTTPSALLTVTGTIQSASGGVKFPDNSTQTTAVGNVSLKYYANSDTAIPVGVFTTPNFNTKIWDTTSGAFSAGTFTAPEAGKYLVQTSGIMSLPAWEADSYINGARVQAFIVGGNYNAGTGSDIVSLNAGDTYQVRFYTGNAAGILYGNAFWTWIAITKIAK